MSRNSGITVDAKRRWALPVMLRHELGKPGEDGSWAFYIGYEDDGCLYLMTPQQYDDYRAEIDALFDDADPDDRAARTQILGNYVRVHTDAQNRLTIPEEHLEYASLRGKIDLVCGTRRSEIWQSDSLRRRREDSRGNASARLAERRAQQAKRFPVGSVGEGS